MVVARSIASYGVRGNALDDHAELPAIRAAGEYLGLRTQTCYTEKKLELKDMVDKDIQSCHLHKN